LLHIWVITLRVLAIIPVGWIRLLLWRILGRLLEICLWSLLNNDVLLNNRRGIVRVWISIIGVRPPARSYPNTTTPPSKTRYYIQ
jgi:hypothetical protein